MVDLSIVRRNSYLDEHGNRVIEYFDNKGRVIRRVFGVGHQESFMKFMIIDSKANRRDLAYSFLIAVVTSKL